MLPTLRAAHPFSSLASLNRLDSLFDRLLSSDGDGTPSVSFGSRCRSRSGKTTASIFLEAELPGVSEKDVDITVHEGVLTIKAERQDQEGRDYLHKGRSFRPLRAGDHVFRSRSIPRRSRRR